MDKKSGELKYKERLQEAATHFQKLRTPATKSKDDKATGAAVKKATTSAINVVLAGLAEDLSAIIKAGGSDSNSEVDECFAFAGSAVRRVFGMADIKSGSASWLTYAMKGIKEPKAESEDTWVSSLGRH